MSTDSAEHDEGPQALRMAHHIGAIPHIIPLSESLIVSNFESTVYHTEQPNLSFHPSAKSLLARAIHSAGYKVILSGEGSDEIFGGYAFVSIDFLRAVDPAAVKLGFPLPDVAEMKRELEGRMASVLPQDHISIRYLGHEDEMMGRGMLGGIFGHRFVAAMSPEREVFCEEVRKAVPECEHSEVIAEGLSPVVRRNAVSGRWHPLNTSMVRLLPIPFHQCCLSGELF